MQVWLVTSGTYSDYNVHAVCSSLENAQAYMDKRDELLDDDNYTYQYWNDPEAFELDEPLEKVRNHWEMYGWFQEDGFVRQPPQEVECYGNMEDISVRWNFERHQNTHRCYLCISGIDLQRCRKVYAERKAYILANWQILTLDMNTIHEETLPCES